MDGTARISPFDSGADRFPATAPVAEMLRTFWRQKFLLAGLVILITGLSAFAAFQIEPRYTAVARILLAPEPAPSAAADRASAARAMLTGGGERAALFSEIEVMKSDRLLGKVVAGLSLDADPEFNPALQPGFLAPVRDLGPVRWLIMSLSPLRHDLSDSERASRERKRIVDSVRKRMVVRPPGLANIISIQFETRSARKSARMANAFVNIYNEDRLARSAQEAAEVKMWLDSRILELRDEVETAETAAAEFLAARRLDQNGQSLTVERQFTEVSRQLAVANASVADKRVRLSQLRALMAAGESLESTTEIQESRAIQRLREQEGSLVRRAAELDTRFGEKHPTMINLRAEIENIRARISEEQKRVVDAMANELQVAAAAAASLRKQLSDLDAERAGSNSDRVRLLQLQRDAIAGRKLYEMFLTRAKETEQTATIKRQPVEVISPAQAPTHPSYPRKGLIVGFGFFLSLGFGLMVVLLIERMDGGFRSVAQVERVIGEPTIGLVPRVGGSERRRGPVADLVFRDTRGAYVEAIRSLRTSLLVSSPHDPPKVVLVASSQSGDGKTSLAVSLARLSALAAAEGRVLLIDGDLRKPSVAPALGLSPERGLLHLFAGEAEFRDVILTDERSGLHVLPSVPGTPNPPELLNSNHMRDLLAELRATYDMIVIDSPALDAVSDARVLAHYADTTVFVVRWEGTKQHAAIESMKQLVSAGARVAGVVLQQVNVRKSASYGYREAVA
ncbi:MAG: polysaccharide biosynthesis tyrosine autokinase [Rhodospirillaceae bacterium]